MVFIKVRKIGGYDMNNALMFSSEKDTWETPIAFFKELNNEFNFTLDPCCYENSAKCQKYYTPKEDGLIQSWEGEIVFCNPPYGRAMYSWVKKCSEESKKSNTKVVMLIPSRTDTRYFHEFIYKKATEIRFIKGRLRFGEAKDNAPFPSMVVIF